MVRDETVEHGLHMHVWMTHSRHAVLYNTYTRSHFLNWGGWMHVLAPAGALVGNWALLGPVLTRLRWTSCESWPWVDRQQRGSPQLAVRRDRPRSQFVSTKQASVQKDRKTAMNPSSKIWEGNWPLLLHPSRDWLAGVGSPSAILGPGTRSTPVYHDLINAGRYSRWNCANSSSIGRVRSFKSYWWVCNKMTPWGAVSPITGKDSVCWSRTTHG